VSLGKFGGNRIQEWADLVFRERHDPGENPASVLWILRSERAQKNARLVRPEDRDRSFDVDRNPAS